MSLNDMDEFSPDLEDIVDDADAPPGRVEIGSTEFADGHSDGIEGESPASDDPAYLRGYHEGLHERSTTNLGYQHELDDTEIGADGISGEQTEIGSEGLGDPGQTEIGEDGIMRAVEIDQQTSIGSTGAGPTEIGEDGIMRAVEIDEQIGVQVGPDTITPWDAFESEPVMIGADGISGEQTEIGEEPPADPEERAFLRRQMMLRRPAAMPAYGRTTNVGYLDDGYEGSSGEQTEIGHRGGGHRGGGHRGGGHRGGGWRGGGWGYPVVYEYALPGIELDEILTEDDLDEAEAVIAVIKTARDNRMPPPKMVAVDADAPEKSDADSAVLTETVVGAAMVVGKDPFPLTTQLLQRFGAGGVGRMVRIDTEESYEAFRAESSPALAALRAQVEELSDRLDAHEADPDAHDIAHFEGDMDNLEMIGASVAVEQAQKRVDLWLPERFRRHIKAWREGDFVCASINLPGADGGLRICTSMEPIVRCVDEMTRHAVDSGVPSSTVIGALPEMGCVLGAGTIAKEMAAAAPSILSRPEAKHAAPFVVRIEPKASPALCALAALAYECRSGNKQACTEWSRLAEVAPPVVRQAMGEALVLAKEVA